MMMIPAVLLGREREK